MVFNGAPACRVSRVVQCATGQPDLPIRVLGPRAGCVARVSRPDASAGLFRSREPGRRMCPCPIVRVCPGRVGALASRHGCRLACSRDACPGSLHTQMFSSPVTGLFLCRVWSDGRLDGTCNVGCPSWAFHKSPSCAFGIACHILLFLPKHTGFLSLLSNGRISMSFFIGPVAGLCEHDILFDKVTIVTRKK